MIKFFSGKTADDVWRRLAVTFSDGDQAPAQTSRAGPTREILHAVVSVEDPRQRWVTSRRPPINPAFAIAEVVWIVTGRRDAQFLTFFNRQYVKHAGPGPIYHGAYGWRLRHQFGQDQLARAYSVLSSCPDSRQVVLQIWDTALDMPEEDGRARAQDIPCNVIAMLKVREKALEWTQVLRSNDVFKGVPYNFVQFTSLQEIMAGWLGLRVGSYNHLSDSLHLYDEDRPNLMPMAPVRDAVNTDDIALPRDESEPAFAELASRIERLIQPDLTSNALSTLSRWPRGDTAFQNMLRLLSAEAARRKGWSDLAQGIMADCTNPAFVNLWDGWMRRVGQPGPIGRVD
jgi:thymidylate synthase